MCHVANGGPQLRLRSIFGRETAAPAGYGCGCARQLPHVTDAGVGRRDHPRCCERTGRCASTTALFCCVCRDAQRATGGAATKCLRQRFARIGAGFGGGPAREAGGGGGGKRGGGGGGGPPPPHDPGAA
eukprot:COSAG04_NODE_5231_length_1693_cov_2.159975_1_plen_128_part_10